MPSDSDKIMNTISVDTCQLIDAALESLDRYSVVVIPVRGSSMLPFIIENIERVELSAVPRQLKRGDIVLAWVDNSRYVLHRIIDISASGEVTLQGDGNVVGVERCRLEDVRAWAHHTIGRHEKRHFLYSRPRRVAARVWLWLRPVRRYLLFIYRRTVLKIM